MTTHPRGNEFFNLFRSQAIVRSGFEKFLEATGGDKPVGHITKDPCRSCKESMTAAGGSSYCTALPWAPGWAVGSV